jgi:lipid-binding SYLF domain-containing protein
MRISRIGTTVMWGLAVCALGSLLLPMASQAASAQEIDAAANTMIAQFKSGFSSGSTVLAQAKGVLAFPEVIQAGVGIGGQYGEGVLRIHGHRAGYYSFSGGSIGLQFGAQRKSILIAFMQDEALRRFQQRAREGDTFQIGGDASVAFLTVGSEAAITSLINQPIVAFVFNQAGLMGSLSLEGSNIARIER